MVQVLCFVDGCPGRFRKLLDEPGIVPPVRSGHQVSGVRVGMDKVRHQELLQIEAELNQRYGDRINVTFSLPDCLEVMHAGVHKGNAVRAVLEQHGLEMSQAVAFGDGMNDFEMLSMVGRGVVMGNAHDRLKLALPNHDQTLSSDEDGVAVYLERLFAPVVA